MDTLRTTGRSRLIATPEHWAPFEQGGLCSLMTFLSRYITCRKDKALPALFGEMLINSSRQTELNSFELVEHVDAGHFIMLRQVK